MAHVCNPHLCCQEKVTSGSERPALLCDLKVVEEGLHFQLDPAEECWLNKSVWAESAIGSDVGPESETLDTQVLCPSGASDSISQQVHCPKVDMRVIE